MTAQAGQSGGPLGLIAGKGDLPVRIAAEARAAGREVHVLRLLGFEEDALAEYPCESVGLGQIGRMFSLLKAAGCRDVVFAGNVKRPNFSQLKLDFRGARLLPAVLKAAKTGDDALMRVLVEAFDQEGFNVIGAEQVATGLVESPGTLTAQAPDADALADIAKAAHVAAEIGRLDIGQGCVVCAGLVLAVEAQEGTDAMLVRVAGLPEAVRGTQGARRGVLVKRPKPQQERRIDLPTIGVATVERVAAAGLAGLAVEAHAALILDRDAVIAAADRLGLFVHVFDPESLS